MEVWKDIIDFPNYQVSNLGNVKNKSTLRILKPIERHCSLTYTCFGVSLKKDNKQATKLIHRLVAETFIPKIEGKNVVDHIDGDSCNNNVSNLRWVTTTENGRNSNNRLYNSNTTGQKNISLHRGSRYVIHVLGKYISSHATLEEAIKARDEFLT